jgi:hypothetical protein
MHALFATFARIQNIYPVFSNGLFKAEKEEGARGLRVALFKLNVEQLLTNP